MRRGAVYEGNHLHGTCMKADAAADRCTKSTTRRSDFTTTHALYHWLYAADSRLAFCLVWIQSLTQLLATYSSIVPPPFAALPIDVKNVFYVFLSLKNVGKVQSGKQINKKHFQNNSNEIDLWFMCRIDWRTAGTCRNLKFNGFINNRILYSVIRM